MSSLGVPDSLVYGAKPTASPASKVRQNLPPINGTTFSPSSLIQISIPTSRGTYLNPKQSYLKFSVKNTGASALTLDFNCNAFIRQLSVRLGSSVLETIGDYNALSMLLTDVQGTSARSLYSGNVLEGSSATTVRTGDSISGGETRTFAVPLVSGILGVLLDKYLPLGMMNNSLLLELTLADSADPQANATAATWTVSDVEFIAEVVQVSQPVDAAIRQLNSDGVRIPTQTFAMHANSIAGGTTSNILLSSNASSAKTLFSIFRLQGNFGDHTKKTISARRNPFQDGANGAQWSYTINGHRVPSKPVRSDAEAYMELQKSLHAIGAADAHGQIEKSTWTASEGAYVVATDLDNFSHKPFAKSGVDVANSTMYLDCIFNTSLAAPVTVTTWVHMDATLMLYPNGQAETMY